MNLVPISDEQLHAYVDELLPPMQRDEVEHYLTQHPEESERAKAYRRQRDLLRSTFDSVLREPVPERLGARALRERRSPWLQAAAAIALLAFGGVAGWTLRGEQAPAPALVSADAEIVQRARMAHIVYAAETRRAVEVAASQEEDMIRWLSKRMNAAVRVPRLEEFGFAALGGRLLPGSAGPACQIMYQNAQGKRLTLYLANAAGAVKPVRFSDDDSVHVVFWSDGTLAFAVSAELGHDELGRIAKAVALDARARG